MSENTKRIIAVIAIILIILIIFVTVLLIFPKNKKTTEKEKWPEKITSKETAETYVDNLSNLIINGGTKEEYTKAFGSAKVPQLYIMTGEYSSFRVTPSSKIIEEYNLKEYVDKQEELAKNLEKHIKDNFSYNIEGTVEEENYYSVLVSYKSYYYLNYSNDLNEIRNLLLTKAGYNLDENITENDKFIADSFKAKVKAADLLDNYLDSYNNSNEENSVYVRFDNREKASSFDNLQSYLINLNGYAYHNNAGLSKAEALTPTVNSYTAENALELN